MFRMYKMSAINTIICYYGYYDVDTFLVKIQLYVFAVLVFMLIQTSNLDIFDPNESSPCETGVLILRVHVPLYCRFPENDYLSLKRVGAFKFVYHM
jgi:hypothetical protein